MLLPLNGLHSSLWESVQALGAGREEGGPCGPRLLEDTPQGMVQEASKYRPYVYLSKGCQNKIELSRPRFQL